MRRALPLAGSLMCTWSSLHTAQNAVSHCLHNMLPKALLISSSAGSCRRRYVEEATELVERHTFEVAALTWNVNEARPDPQTGVHRWVIDLSKEASLFVVALQEIESGGGSLALAAAKDALLTKQQASTAL